VLEVHRIGNAGAGGRQERREQRLHRLSLLAEQILDHGGIGGLVLHHSHSFPLPRQASQARRPVRPATRTDLYTAAATVKTVAPPAPSAIVHSDQSQQPCRLGPAPAPPYPAAMAAVVSTRAGLA
jgi:hypothetical protein